MDFFWKRVYICKYFEKCVFTNQMFCLLGTQQFFNIFNEGSQESSASSDKAQSIKVERSPTVFKNQILYWTRGHKDIGEAFLNKK